MEIKPSFAQGSDQELAVGNLGYLKNSTKYNFSIESQGPSLMRT